MKETLTEILKGLCEEYDSVYCIAARTTGERMTTVGSPSSLRWTGLIRLLFGDASTIVDLNERLQRRILPQLFTQGEEKCVVIKPFDDLLVGFFHQGSKDQLQLFNEGREISQRIADALGGPS